MSDSEQSIEIYTGNFVKFDDSNCGTHSDESEAKSDVESDAVSETKSDAVSGAESEAESGAESEADSGAESEAESGAESEAESNVESEAESEAESETESEAESNVESDAESELEQKVEPGDEQAGDEQAEDEQAEDEQAEDEQAEDEQAEDEQADDEVEDEDELEEEEIDNEDYECDSNSGDELHQLKKQVYFMNQNFIMIRSLIKKGFEEMKTNIHGLQDELIDLKQQVDLTIPKSLKNTTMVEVKKNVIEIHRDVMMKYVNRQPLTADKQLFKYYYLNNKAPPIRKISPSIYEYWADGKWNLDKKRGKYVIEIIAYNLQKSWLRLQPSDDVKKDLFLNIQAHIDKLCQSNYKSRLLRAITEELIQD
jgi:hypothetical protein